MTEDDVFPIAQAAARAYCKRYGADEQFDDAVGDSSLYLLEHRAIWEKPKSAIVVRLIGELVRGYQNANGLRLKNPPQRYLGEYDFESYSKGESTAEPNPRLTIIERTLASPYFKPYADVVLGLSNGRTKRELARQYRLSQRAISRLYSEFRAACISADRGVTLVDPREEPRLENCPLFY